MRADAVKLGYRTLDIKMNMSHDISSSLYRDTGAGYVNLENFISVTLKPDILLTKIHINTAYLYTKIKHKK